MKGKITVKFLFAAIQSLLAFSAIIIAILLHFNIFNIQSALNVAHEALNFYVAVLTIFGLVFLLGGLFLVYDWWESRWKSTLKESEIQ